MESLCFKPALPIAFGGGLDACMHPAQVNKLGRGSTISLNASGVSAERSAAPTASSSGSYFSAFPLQFLWSSGKKGNDEIAPEEPGFAAGGGEEEIDEEEEGIEGNEEEEEELILPKKQRRRSWVLKILQIGSIWAEKAKRSNRVVDTDDGSSTIDRDNCSCCCNDDGSDSCGVGDAEKTAVAFDTESFSRMLRRVSLAEARSYAQMSYLGNLAYDIPKIKPGNLLKYQGLRFVTSSLKKEAEALNTEKSSILDKGWPVNDENEQISNHVQEQKKEKKELDEAPEGESKRKFGYGVSASAAYQIVATAASYLHSQTRSILPFRSRGEKTTENSLKTVIGLNRNMEVTSSEAASFVVATNSVTAVVAGEEEMKQAVANELSSPKSSPCQWFVCDDDSSATRFFVIQGSESFASWQANLLFEPIQFEGLDVLVHRGIYEVAKGIYEQILPEVQAHLRSHGDSATLRFTGHSLGGSLSMLLNLMLLIRGDAPLSSLLPVVTFGSPFIMCGGDKLLYKLGLPHSHIQAIIMHRDIVPRAFSCCYPDRIVELLRAISGNFRNHPHLRNQKSLYAPMGELLILQPDEKFSPHHHLLPSGHGLYRFICPSSDPRDTTMQAAQIFFLNSPHPLEILSDRSAYGSNGAIHRDHHMNAYLRSVRSVFHQEVRHARKANRERRRQAWWPIVAPPEALYASLILGQAGKLDNATQHQLLSLSNDSSQSRQEPWKWFSKLVASQHMPILMLFVVPMRFLLLGTVALMGVQ